MDLVDQKSFSRWRRSAWPSVTSIVDDTFSHLASRCRGHLLYLPTNLTNHDVTCMHQSTMGRQQTANSCQYQICWSGRCGNTAWNPQHRLHDLPKHTIQVPSQELLSDATCHKSQELLSCIFRGRSHKISLSRCSSDDYQKVWHGSFKKLGLRNEA